MTIFQDIEVNKFCVVSKKQYDAVVEACKGITLKQVLENNELDRVSGCGWDITVPSLMECEVGIFQLGFEDNSIQIFVTLLQDGGFYGEDQICMNLEQDPDEIKKHYDDEKYRYMEQQYYLDVYAEDYEDKPLDSLFPLFEDANAC